MQIIEWSQFLEEALSLGGNPAAVTVGVFDGVHRGHRALIERVVSHNGTAPVVVTFTHSLYKKNRSEKHPGDILSFRQKTAAFESLGVSVTIAIEFSESIRRMSGTGFLRILQEHGKMSFMALGSNFRCGYQLDTDVSVIQKANARQNIETDIVQPLTEGSEPISSSRVRAAITGGNLEAAAAMLGRPFTVDLAGAAVSSADGGTIYNIAGQGRILPPPGSYQVFLAGGSGGRYKKTRSEILVEDGCVKIRRNTAGDNYPEYAEFIPL